MTVYHDNQVIPSLQPQFVDALGTRIPRQSFAKRIIRPSKMFVIKEELKLFKAKNPDTAVYNASQGDGGMSLGGVPPEELAAALVRYLPSEASTAYGSPVGRQDVRTAICERYHRLSSLSPEHVIIGDGGRDLLQKWFQMIQQETGGIGGSIVVSSAPWGSYKHVTYMNGLNVMMAPGNADTGFRITPEGIDHCIALAKKANRDLVGLVITSPDNPTGNTLEQEDIKTLIEHAVARGISYVMVDLMYHVVTDPGLKLYDIDGLITSLSPKALESTVLLDGLTKAIGGSNLRSCHLVCGSLHTVQRIKGLATHSVLPNALGEAAALEVYGAEDPFSHPWVQRVVKPTAASRALLRKRLPELGLNHIIGQGYYTFINIWPWLGASLPAHVNLKRADGSLLQHIDSVETLKSYLAQCCGVAIIHGSVFQQPDFIRFSYANTPEYTNQALNTLYNGLQALKPTH